MKLFRKNLERHCAYCANGCRVSEREIACVYKGIMDDADRCHRFSYDPLKRVPPRPVALRTEKYSAEEFRL